MKINYRSIEEKMTHQVIRFSRQHRYRMQTLMEQNGISRGQPPILHILKNKDGSTQTELAADLNLTPATITKMLQRMETAGLVSRRPDLQDHRITRVYLTPGGSQKEEDIRQYEEQAGKEMTQGFSPEEIAQLENFLIRMRDNLIAAQTSHPD